MTAAGDGVPDIEPQLRILKDFQRDSVEYAFRRLYLDSDSTQRFLVADEVGLGKTLVARGVIQKAIQHLWHATDRIDIVYVCSNAAIARQNIRRLGVEGQEANTSSSRLTLLPLTLSDLSRNKVNFIAFTPGTSFEYGRQMGMAEERRLLYWLLRDAWAFGDRAAPKNLLQGDVGDPDRWRQTLAAGPWRPPEATVAAAFESRMLSDQSLRNRFDDLATTEFARHRPTDRIPWEARKQRGKLISELRSALAATCLQALDPDLVILDEFQRFKTLLDPTTEAGDLAHQLFTFERDGNAARTLLLSATPYKMYSRPEDVDGDHYSEFVDTVSFLEAVPKGQTSDIGALVTEYRTALLSAVRDSDNVETANAARIALQERLRRVMSRTQRVISDAAGLDGMLREEAGSSPVPTADDVAAYVSLATLARDLKHPDPIAYWKSSPYLPNLMDKYQFKDKLAAGLDREDVRASLSQLRASGGLFDRGRWAGYADVSMGNARLEKLRRQLTAMHATELAWLPPSLPYYALDRPYRDAAAAGITKRLVFSAWAVVPKAIAALLSYDAERHAMRALDPAATNTAEDRKTRRPLLRFALAAGRHSGMSVLGLIYPSSTLAQHLDPLRFAAVLGGDALPTGRSVQRRAITVARQLLSPLPAGRPDGPEDESWYWLAPILLDLRSDPAAVEWWSRPEAVIAREWAGGHASDEDHLDGSWISHVKEAQRLAHAVHRGDVAELGRRPRKLDSVLALMGLAAPGTAALRALARASGASASSPTGAIRTAAGSVAWSFRALVSGPEVQALIRARSPKSVSGRETPYWRAVLAEGFRGCLQAVLDEYAHVLRDGQGVTGKPPDEAAAAIAAAMREAMTLRTSVLRGDDIDDGSIDAGGLALRAHFARRLGEDASEQGGAPERQTRVKDAFNSPFRPFVLATTSVGQEGLDFHHYCHAVVHWDLPYNPVDMEQREGRVHRFKGHAIRKNVAERHGIAAFGTGLDPWDAMFAAANRGSVTDLVPYWVYRGSAKIERHVFAYALSTDVGRLVSMRKALASYRMVFGQQRQEDLLEFLGQLPDDRLAELQGVMQLDLTPDRIRGLEPMSGGGFIPDDAERRHSRPQPPSPRHRGPGAPSG